MLQTRPTLGSPRLAAALAFVALAGVTRVDAQIVHTFDQARSTSAHANAASRDNSVVGFGNWNSNLQVEAPGTASAVSGVATQTSGIYGDSTVAHGEAGSRAAGAPGSGDGSSNFSVHFLVAVRTGYTLRGNVASRAAAVGGEGEANAMIQFSDANGTLASVQTDCGVNSGQPQACDKADELIASGILEPGAYLLEAHASSAATGAAAASGEGAAHFDLRIWFDGPIVGAAPATWSNLKSLYR